MKTDTKTLAATLRKVADGDTVRDCLGRVAADRLDELERELAELTEWREMIDREVGTLREELATERELADRLAIAIEQVLPAFGAGGDLSKAWDTWNKARN